ADRNRSHWSTSKTPSYTKSVSWQHHLAKIVKKYQSSLTLVNNDKEIPIKGMMSILGAGVKGNTMIDLICDGQDELAFMDELKSAFADGFGESV
ncbi:HPr family phosphocarrier protein, partial [Salmonella enterica]|nr:HPr family phosphocarrier protein [Salmonella enterica]MCQ7468067.1 HPr family phosphocarrier protein [Salmonella enterica]MCQ7540077.1 HPr family phosphocarrier protein [Salmonella enterica]